jgi:ferritin-like metal-binding protein YciE
MTTHIKKINNKLDALADKAKGGAEKIAEKIIDSANDVAHSAAEKARHGTEKVGEKMIAAGEKITKLAK